MKRIWIFLIGVFWMIVLGSGAAGAQGDFDSGAYELSYTVSGKGGARMELADGYFLLRLDHTGDSVTYTAADGVHTHPAGGGQYTIRVVSGFAQIYYNGQYSFSYNMPRTDEKQDAPIAMENGIIISDITLSPIPGRAVIYQKECSGMEDICVNINPGCHYDMEFNIKKASGQEINIYDGTYQLKLVIGDWIRAAVSPDGQRIEEKNIAKALDGNVYYRVSVHDGIAQIFGDNHFLASLRLPKNIDNPKIEVIVDQPDSAGRFLIRNNRDLFTFYDSFDGRGESDSEAYWNVEKAGENTRVLLSTAGKSPRLLAKVVLRQENGAFFMTLCYQNEDTNIKAGYNFDRSAWELYTTNAEEMLQASSPGTLPEGELDLEMAVLEGRIQFFCNGEQIFDEPAIYDGGRVGFFIQDCPIQIKEVYYEGESPVIAGMKEYNFSDLHTVELVQTAPETLFMIGSGGAMYRSRDQGISWEKYGYSKYFSSNTLFLKSGKLLTIQRVAGEKADTYWDEAWISDDRGNCFEGPYRIETRESNRITMNNKLTQLKSGRIVFCAGESGHGMETEGALGIYYSDDDGVTWQESENPLTIFNTGVNVQEGKVVELPDGSLRCYMRTDLGFLYYSESKDQGKSWSTELKATEFISTLCAMNIERDPYEENTYYMVWEHNNTNLNKQSQFPRNRISLAVSYDGCETWEYVTDLMEMTGNGCDNLHANQGVRITRDAVYAHVLNITNYEGESGVFTQRLWRLEKDQIRSIKRFPGVHGA